MAVAQERRVRRDAGFGQRLTEAMDRRKVRPGELALSQAVGAGTVSRWRAGECPDDLRLPALATYLRVPEEWLKTGGGALPDWERVDVPQAQPGRGPGRRLEDKERAIRADVARLDVLLDRIKAYRDAGKAPSPEILSEWLAIMQANAIQPEPSAGPAAPRPDLPPA